MKLFISTIFFLLLNLSLFSQQYMEHIVKAMDLNNENKFKESVDEFKTAFTFQEGTWRPYYYAACTAAMTKENEQCILWLEKAIEKGFCDMESLDKFDALSSVRKHEKWKKLIENANNNFSKEKEENRNSYNKPMREFKLTKSNLLFLENIMKKDDPHLLYLKEQFNKQDSLSLKELIYRLENFGWQDETHGGIIENRILFSELIDVDLAIKEKYLPSVQKAVENGKIMPQMLAILTDRILLEKGEKQIYGTQLSFNSVLKTNYVRPLIDPENVDLRRNSMELPNMEKYLKNWNIDWNMKEYIAESEIISQYEKSLTQKEISNFYDIYSFNINKSIVFPGCENIENEKEVFSCLEQKIRNFVGMKFNTELVAELGLDDGIYKIFMYFVIDKTGEVKDIQAFGTHIALENEGIRVVKLLPKMKPGSFNGIPTSISYSLPIAFKVE